MGEKKYEVLVRAGLQNEIKPGELTIGDNVAIERRVSIDISADVTIGDNTIICEDVLILTHEHDMDDPFNKHKHRRSPLNIGENVWIGARAIILERVNEIGSGAVIGAGSVVTRDILYDEHVAGNPARMI